MTVGNAIVNQALGAANRTMTGGLKKVMGNLPGSALRGRSVASGLPAQGSPTMNLSYPLDVETSSQQGHYIMFMINVTSPALIEKQKHAELMAELDQEDADAGTGPQQQIGGVKAADVGDGKSRISSAPRGAIAVKRPPTVRLAKAISLYMPPQVRATYNTSYTEEEIASLSEAGVAGIQRAFDAYAAGGIRGLIPDMDTAKDGGQAVAEVLSNLTMGATKATVGAAGPLLGIAGAAGALEIASGKILSKKMELLFTGIGRRKFSFTFTFIPKSEQESKIVDEIIYTFKRHMIPDFADVSVGGVALNSQGRILNIPDTFDIQYMFHSKENPWFNKISTCYLQNMDVQYGGDRMTYYEPLEHEKGVGPPPQSTTVTLAFEEIEKMSRPRIEEGF